MVEKKSSLVWKTERILLTFCCSCYQSKLLWREISRKLFSLFLHKNICCGYSLNAPHSGALMCITKYAFGASNEYPQNTCMFSPKNTVFDLITAHTPISAQSRNSVVFRLQPMYFFLYFFTKAYVVGTHLNCIDKSMQFKWVPTTYAFVDAFQMSTHNICLCKEIQKKIA